MYEAVNKMPEFYLIFARKVRTWGIKVEHCSPVSYTPTTIKSSDLRDLSCSVSMDADKHNGV